MSKAKSSLSPYNQIELVRRSGSPLYQQLAEAIERTIEDGVLKAGDKLPPHHDLADVLDINIVTVTKAIGLLKEKGLIDSRPGRGTLVKPLHQEPQVQFQSAPVSNPGLIDLSVNRPATKAYEQHLKDLLPELVQDPRYSFMEDYQPSEGPVWGRQAGAEWVSRYGPQVTGDQVLITQGAQHALVCALVAVTQPGDVIVADEVTYQGINALCRTMHLNLVGVRGDKEGMDPAALDKVCQQHEVRALFVVPTLHNPTTITLSEVRRRALLAVARKHDILVIEDDVYAPLLEARPVSFATMDPERTIYITCLSKCIAPGLRAGFIVPPTRLVPDVSAAIRVGCWSVSPLNCLITNRLIEGGQAEAIINAQKTELRQREEIARKLLSGLEYRSVPTSPHLWLTLPEPWRGAGFAAVSEKQGVRVLPAEAFTLGRSAAPHAVRVNLAAARTQEDLRKGLKVLRNLAEKGHVYAHHSI